MIKARRERAEALSKLEILATYGAVDIQRTGLPCMFEVTTFVRGGDHTHHGGASLVEAIDRAYQRMVALPSGSVGK